MNSRQKIVQQSFLDDEAGILRLLHRSYSEALEEIKEGIEEKYEAIAELTKEINDLPPNDPKRVVLEGRRMAKVYQKQYQESLERQVSGILGDMDAKNYANVTDYLEGCYDNGFLGAMYDIHGQGIPLTLPINQQKAVHAVQTDSKISEGLYRRLGKDTADLKRKITSQVSRSMITGESYGQCAQALERQAEIGFNRAARIARTEGHRIQVTAAMDALYDAREAGADVVKQWDATLDKRTRRSHARCDGEIREIDDTFGNGLMCPGDPKGPASEVVNCRCALLQRARWGLDDDELATLKERAAYFGLDKADSFEDFKGRYLEATEAHDVSPVTEREKLVNPKRRNRIEIVDDRKRARRKGESGAVKRNAIGATYSEIFKARDEEVERADLNKIKQTQLVHIPGTKQNRQAAKDRGIEPSCFTISIDEIKELIKKHAGCGIPDNLYGYKWNRKEKCTADHVIGYIINQDGDKVPTRCFKIHYSNNGVHAVPRFDEGGEPDDV